MTEDQQIEIGTFSCSYYLPDGTKMFYVRKAYQDIVTESMAFAADALARGLTLEAPGIDDGNAVTIATVMRRAKGDGTPIIDFYPEWGFPVTGKETFGTFRSLGIYMNESEPQLVADFLTISGFKSLEQIPLYDGQSPLKRTEGRAHPKETKVPTPFKIIREQGEEKIGSDGKPYRSWKLVRYEAINGNIIVDSPKNEPEGAKETNSPLSSIDDKDTTWVGKQKQVQDFCSAVATYFMQQRIKVDGNTIFGAINLVTQQSAARFSEFINTTQADAWAAVLLHMANGNKANALAQVKGDAVLTKAINFWSQPVEDIKF